MWSLPLKTLPLPLALAIKKAKYDALDLENYMPNSSIDKKKRAGSFLPSIGNPMIAIMSRSVRLIMVKGKRKSFMEMAEKPRKLNTKAMLIEMSCQESMISS